MTTKDWEIYSDEIENLIDAIPLPGNNFLSTIQIWHAAKSPKPPYGACRRMLKEMVSNGLCEKVGCNAQFYRITRE